MDDTTVFYQKFFSDEMRGKNEKYGYFLMTLAQMKPRIVNADSIAVDDEDLSKHYVSPPIPYRLNNLKQTQKIFPPHIIYPQTPSFHHYK